MSSHTLPCECKDTRPILLGREMIQCCRGSPTSTNQSSCSRLGDFQGLSTLPESWHP